MWIVFEGVDGSGKTTQANLLWRSLLQEGYRACLYREPSGFLWEALKDSLANQSLGALEEALLFCAMRVEIMEKLTKSLEEGFVVISDRSFYSTAVYQGVRGLSKDAIDVLNALVVKRKPDLVFLCDVSPTVALSRIKERGESADEQFLLKLRQAYLSLAKQEGFYVVDANKPTDQVHKEVLEVVLRRLANL